MFLQNKVCILKALNWMQPDIEIFLEYKTVKLVYNVSDKQLRVVQQNWFRIFIHQTNNIYF